MRTKVKVKVMMMMIMLSSHLHLASQVKAGGSSLANLEIKLTLARFSLIPIPNPMMKACQLRNAKTLQVRIPP